MLVIPTISLSQIQNLFPVQATGADPANGIITAILIILGGPFLSVLIVGFGLSWYFDDEWDPSWSGLAIIPLGAVLLEWGAYYFVTKSSPKSVFPVGALGLAGLTGAAIVAGASIKSRDIPKAVISSAVMTVGFILAYTSNIGSMPLLIIGYVLFAGVVGYAVAKPSSVDKDEETTELSSS